MQKVTNINIRVDEELKKQANELFEYFGMSLSQAITLFLKQAVNTSSIPFEIKKPEYSKDLIEALAEAEEMEKHPEKYKTYHSIEELMEDLEEDETV